MLTTITYRGQFRWRDTRRTTNLTWWEDVPPLETDVLTITAVRRAAFEQGGKLMRLRKYEDGVEIADVYGPFD